MGFTGLNGALDGPRSQVRRVAAVGHAPENFFYATDYGVGPSNPDNTAAFVAAINDIPASGGTLILPCGILNVSTININKSVHLIGQGWAFGGGQTQICGTSVSLPVINVGTAFVLISELAVISSIPAASRTGPGIAMPGGVSQLENIAVTGHQYGIHVTSPGNQMTNVMVQGASRDGVWLDSNGTNQGATGTVLFYTQANANTGSGIVITGNSGGFGAGVQMYISTGEGNGGSGTLLTGNVNDVYMSQSGGGTNAMYGIDMTGLTGGNVSISQALVELEGQAGIVIGAGASMINITGSTITGSNHGIISSGQHVTIGNCNFGANGIDAILLNAGSSHTVLTGLVSRGACTNGVNFAGGGAIIAAAVDFTAATNPRAGALPPGSSVAACPGF